MAPIDDAEDERESSRAEQAAIKTTEAQRRRNLSRLKAADERDTQLLGELEPEGTEYTNLFYSCLLPIYF